MTGREIIKTVMAERGIGPKDLFSPSRRRHIVDARRTAAVELCRAGLSKAAIGRMLHRDPTTIAHHLLRAE